MKKVFSVLVIAIIFITSISFYTSAYNWDVKIGDVTGDFSVDILDATEIQRVLARIIETNDEIEYIGDVDEDGRLSVVDATNIQRWLAELNDNEIIEKSVSRRIDIHDFYQNYDSGIAMAGIPVTFTINAEAQAKITSYVLYVNDELVAYSETSNSIEYTFPEPGKYHVKMEVNTPLRSQSVDYIGEYVTFNVVEQHDNDVPVIKALYITGQYFRTVAYSHSGLAINAEAMGGTAPYEYKFILTRPRNLKNIKDTITIEQDYSTKNYFELECIDYEDVRIDDQPRPVASLPCLLDVYVKDANGIEVSKTTEEIVYSDYPIG